MISALKPVKAGSVSVSIERGRGSDVATAKAVQWYPARWVNVELLTAVDDKAKALEVSDRFSQGSAWQAVAIAESALIDDEHLLICVQPTLLKAIIKDHGLQFRLERQEPGEARSPVLADRNRQAGPPAQQPGLITDLPRIVKVQGLRENDHGRGMLGGGAVAPGNKSAGNPLALERGGDRKGCWRLSGAANDQVADCNHPNPWKSLRTV